MVAEIGNLVVNGKTYLPRANVASFMLQELNNPLPQHLRALVSIARRGK